MLNVTHVLLDFFFYFLPCSSDFLSTNRSLFLRPFSCLSRSFSFFILFNNSVDVSRWFSTNRKLVAEFSYSSNTKNIRRAKYVLIANTFLSVTYDAILIFGSALPTATNKFTSCAGRCQEVSYSYVWKQRRYINFEAPDDFNREDFTIPYSRNIPK